jgi:hypothetical protein
LQIGIFSNDNENLKVDIEFQNKKSIPATILLFVIILIFVDSFDAW